MHRDSGSEGRNMNKKDRNYTYYKWRNAILVSQWPVWVLMPIFPFLCLQMLLSHSAAEILNINAPCSGVCSNKSLQHCEINI
jgi:hypothetical protein